MTEETTAPEIDIEQLKKNMAGETRKNAELLKLNKEMNERLQELEINQKNTEVREKAIRLALETGLDYDEIIMPVLSGKADEETIKSFAGLLLSKAQNVREEVDDEWRTKAGKPRSGSIPLNARLDFAKMDPLTIMNKTASSPEFRRQYEEYRKAKKRNF